MGHLGHISAVRCDGTEFPIEASISHIEAAGQQLYTVILRDITERKKAEEDLRQSETRYRLATKATNDVIWEWNATTHKLIWSENAQVVFGYSAEEIGPEEKWWDQHIHPDDLERILSRLNDLMRGDGSIWSEEY
ncbi:MAG: PAS domain S-box protein, partial [Candidatus Methanoperedens sp.]|nr:PAS domain S-box protein [Candidatus Methanoperedens sp.]